MLELSLVFPIGFVLPATCIADDLANLSGFEVGLRQALVQLVPESLTMHALPVVPGHQAARAQLVRNALNTLSASTPANAADRASSIAVLTTRQLSAHRSQSQPTICS